MNDLASIVARARAEFEQCVDPAALEDAKAKYLGKAGALTELLKGLGKLSATERPVAGAAINDAKQALEAALDARRTALAEVKLSQQLASDALDVTLPGRGRGRGGLHPTDASARACRVAFPFVGLHRRGRTGNRGRLPQFHSAEYA